MKCEMLPEALAEVNRDLHRIVDLLIAIEETVVQMRRRVVAVISNKRRERE